MPCELCGSGRYGEAHEDADQLSMFPTVPSQTWPEDKPTFVTRYRFASRWPMTMTPDSPRLGALVVGVGPLIGGVRARLVVGRPGYAEVVERGQAYQPGTWLRGEWKVEATDE